jgi:hypothetical protein
MKGIATIVIILLLPLPLFAMDLLSESVLSDFTTNNSLSITTGKDSDTSKFWIRYYNDPANLDFNEDGSGNKETQTTPTVKDSQTDQAANVSRVGPEESRIEFKNGLTRDNEGPTTVEVWLGGLPDQKNAGKICDFYTNQIKSYTFPNSAINVSTH